MRKIAVFFLVFVAVVNLTAQQTHRNRIIYRPFDWQKIEAPDNRYKIYFPKEMTERARFVAREMEKMSVLYREKIFNVDYPIILPDTGRSWLGRVALTLGLADSINIARDADGNVLSEKIQWQPKEVVVILFPNMQDYNQQRVVDVFIPPGVLGFTETLGFRVAHPYSGNRHNLVLVTAHELAHAWMLNFMVEWRAVALKTMKRPVEEDIKLPKLWFIEGFAELLADTYLESIDQGNDYRRAEVNEFNMKSVVGDEMPNLSGRFEVEGWGNYSFGYHFLKFVVKKHSFPQLAELLKLLAEGKQGFEEAWITVFGESLSATELAWRKSVKFEYHEMGLLATADSLEKKSFALPFAVWSANYDPTANQIAGYQADEKWGLRTVVVNIDSLQAFQGRQRELAEAEVELYELQHRRFEGNETDSLDNLRDEKADALEEQIETLKESIERLEVKVVVEVDHQFKDKSLFYRVDNPPVLKGEQVALSVSQHGQDILRVFEIDLSGEETQVRLVQETKFPDVLWINDLAFASDDSLLFVGMDATGEKNIYSFSLSQKKLDKLTNSAGEKFSPKTVGNSILYIEADSIDGRGLYKISDGETFRLKFGEEGFVDQVITLDNLVVIRVLNANGLPEIFIWAYETATAYRYRYGSEIETDKGSRHIAYPLPHQLVGLDRNGELIVSDSESRTAGKYVLQKVRLDLNKLESRQVKSEKVQAAMRSETSVPSDGNYVVQKADKALRFPSFFRDGFYGNGYRMGVTNATGEYALSGILYGSYDNYFGFLYLLQFDYYDFSERLQSLTALSLTRYPNFRNYIYANHSKKENLGLIFDEKVEIRRMYLWPIDLENSVSFGFGLGYLRREYISFLAEESRVLQTPFYKVMGQFVSDGAFVDYLRSSRHGHFFQARGEFAGDNEVLAFDGSAIIDYRYYLRPWQASVYLASRVIFGKAFGRDASWFFIPDLYRRPGLQKHDFNQSFGDELFLYQTEFRLPLVRWAMFDYKFWNNPSPFFLVSVNAHAFLYGGDVRWQSEPFHFAHRAGYGLKFGLGFWPLYIKWEHYSYLGRGAAEGPYLKKLFGNWQDAWVIELEY